MQKLSEKREMIKSLENGKGIQYLLNEAYKILGNPILIHDMEYKAIAYNKDVITDDPIWNEYATTGTVGNNWFDFFKNECFIEAAANAKKITFLTSDKLKYNRIYGKLFNKNNIQVGCAVMVECNKSFEDDVPMLLEEFCTILSKELGENDFYNDYGQAYFEKLVDELITGVNDIALYIAHVESIYMHLKSNLYLAVVDIGKCESKHAKLTYYRNLLKNTQPEYAYAIYSNYIIIIIGTDNQKLYIEKDLNKLNKLFDKENIYAGVSSSFENLFELPKHFKESLDVLNECIENTNQHIVLYEQLIDNKHK